MEIGTVLLWTLVIAYVALVIWAVYKTIINYDNCNPIKTIGWILAFIFLPVIGFIAYIIVGRNLNKKRSYFRKLHDAVKKHGKPQFGFLPEQDDDLMKEYHEMKILLMNLSHLPLFSGNKIDLYPTATEKFHSMFKDIENAKDHIHILYYTIAGDKIGTMLKDLIIKKHKDGVEVRVLYDDIGSNETPKEYFKELREAGIKLAVFSPAVFPKMIKSVNYRNHKKIVVIDGKIGYTGGINVKDEYIDGVDWGVWRDFHLRIQGSGAQGLQSVFLRDWFYESNEYIADQRYYPAVERYGDNFLQVITAEPVDEFANIMQGMAAAISRAKESVYIESPYFVPNETILNAINMASLSGVDVRLIMPDKSDNMKVQYASNSYVQQILASNVKVYRYQAGFIHSKLMVIDDELIIAGSSNMDIRSFELNFETNVFIYNRKTARAVKEIILRDMAECVQLNPEDWANRRLRDKFIDAFFRLFSPLL